MSSRRPTALITGAASGIGLALAGMLASEGMHLVLADLDEAALDQAASSLTGAADVETARLDVSDAEAVAAAVAGAAERHGGLDYLFNNAGVGGTLDVREATLEHWRRVLDVNLMGVIHGVAAAYPLMVRQGDGHIVNTASISGLVPWPGQTLYNTSKYAVVGLSHTLRSEAARLGVKVSVVCPGAVRSNIWGRPILGAPQQRPSPPEAIPADEAAREIWRGVRANQATIVFPRASRIHDRLYRLSPKLLRSEFDRQLSRSLSAR